MERCECKGKRSCLLCENKLQRKPHDVISDYKKLDSHVYCPTCNKIFKGWKIISNCDQHESMEGKTFPGIFILHNFLTKEESEELVKHVDDSWDMSQSGRRKKNFGPKVNFKKKKLRIECFQGFSDYTKSIRKRLKDIEIIKDFFLVEECYMEYDEKRGSHIEKHIDDCWIWGERIVTLNVIGESVLCFTKHFPTYPQQYNLDCIEDYKDKMIGSLISSDTIPDNILVRVPLPAQSVVVIYGIPRYLYEHALLREDIVNRRVCIAYREFAKPFLHLCEHFAE